MVEWLVSSGNKCTVITGYPYYPKWEVHKPYKNTVYKKEIFHGGMLTVYRCPVYIPNNPTGIRRMLHDASFFISSWIVIVGFLFARSYDYMITVSPPFHLGLISLFYRFFKKTVFIYHIQDLQIDAAQRLSMLKSGRLLGFFSKIEKYIIKKADVVSTISEGMVRNIKAKYNREVVIFPNWTNITEYYPVASNNLLKIKWGFAADDYVMLYSGSIGEKQDIDTIILAAANLKDYEKLKFIICGDGAYKSTLQNMAADLNLNNVIFLSLQPKEVFNEFLNMADIHLIMQKAGAGDLVMPSKLTNILAAGGAVLVTASKETSMYEIISNYHMGLLVEPENAAALTAIIKDNYQADHHEIRSNARAYAVEHLSLDNIMNKFIDIISRVKQSRAQT